MIFFKKKKKGPVNNGGRESGGEGRRTVELGRGPQTDVQELRHDSG